MHSLNSGLQKFGAGFLVCCAGLFGQRPSTCGLVVGLAFWSFEGHEVDYN